MRRGPLTEGEPVLLADHRGRTYLVVLRAAQQFHYHNGIVEHDALIGTDPGRTIMSSRQGRLRVMRPTLAEFVLSMPRGATVVYPKDLGPIIVKADVFPGARVLEAGLGSGALSLMLLRAVGEAGCLVSYERRDDHLARGRANIELYLGRPAPNHEIRAGDVVDVPEEGWFDRVVLDLPEPWSVAPVAGRALVAGGRWCSYVPTVPQIEHTVRALTEAGFGGVETVEVLERPWNIEGASVRPAHRMVAHTGFITSAVRMSP